jgi:preprotein translocase subunit SecA
MIAADQGIDGLEALAAEDRGLQRSVQTWAASKGGAVFTATDAQAYEDAVLAQAGSEQLKKEAEKRDQARKAVSYAGLDGRDQRLLDAIVNDDIPEAARSSMEAMENPVKILSDLIHRRQAALVNAGNRVDVYVVSQKEIELFLAMRGLGEKGNAYSTRLSNGRNVIFISEDAGDMLYLIGQCMGDLGMTALEVSAVAALGAAAGATGESVAIDEKQEEAFAAQLGSLGWTPSWWQSADERMEGASGAMVDAFTAITAEREEAKRKHEDAARKAKQLPALKPQDAAAQARGRAAFDRAIKGSAGAAKKTGFTQTQEQKDITDEWRKRCARANSASKLGHVAVSNRLWGEAKEKAKGFERVLKGLNIGEGAIRSTLKPQDGKRQMSTQEIAAEMRKGAKRLMLEVGRVDKAMMEESVEWRAGHSTEIGDYRDRMIKDQALTARDIKNLEENEKRIANLIDEYEALTKSNDLAARDGFLAALGKEMQIYGPESLIERRDEIAARLKAARAKANRIALLLTDANADALSLLAWAESMTKEKLQEEYKTADEIKDTAAKEKAIHEWTVRAAAIFSIVFHLHQMDKGDMWKIRPGQAINAILLKNNFITNMGTGQGKTFSIALANYLNSFSGNTTDVMLKDDFTAVRDFNETRHIYEMLGISCSVITQDMGMAADGLFFKDDKDGRKKQQEELLNRKRLATSKTIRYMSPTFIFDIEHDLVEQNEARRYFTRNFHTIIIDEVDSLFMDQSRTEFIQAVQGLPATFIDALGYQASADFARALMQRVASHVLELRSKAVETKSEKEIRDSTEDFIDYDSKTGRFTISTAGDNKIGELVKAFLEELEQKGMGDIAAKLRNLMGDDMIKKEWTVRIKIALDYLLNHTSTNFLDAEAQSIVLITEATGRVAKGQTWQGGLDQLARAVGGLDINTEGATMAKLTLYDVLTAFYEGRFAGTSGTAMEARKEFRDRADKPVGYVCDFEEYTQRIFRQAHVVKGKGFITALRRMLEARTDEAMRAAVVERNDINELLQWAYKTMWTVKLAKGEGFSGSETAALEKLEKALTVNAAALQQEAQKVFDELSQDAARGTDYYKNALKNIDASKINTLTAHNEPKEVEIIENAGQRGAITFVTNIAGRATDIELQRLDKMIEGAKDPEAITVLKYIRNRIGNAERRKALKSDLEIFDPSAVDVKDGGYDAKIGEAEKAFAAEILSYIVNNAETLDGDEFSRRLNNFADRYLSGESKTKFLGIFGGIEQLTPGQFRTMLADRLPGLLKAIGTIDASLNGCTASMAATLRRIFELTDEKELLESKMQGRAAAGSIAANIVRLTEDSAALRQKDRYGDFTDATKEARKAVIDSLISGLGGLGLSAEIGTTLKEMLLTKYVYGLLFIGQKSPLRRTDLQGHGRPGRAGDPGEYFEIVEDGDIWQGNNTAEFTMLTQRLWNAPQFEFTAFEEHIRKKIDDIRARGETARAERFKRLLGKGGPRLFREFVALRAEYYGYRTVLDRLGAIEGEINTKLTKLASATDPATQNTLTAELGALRSEMANLTAAIGYYRGKGVLADGIGELFSQDMSKSEADRRSGMKSKLAARMSGLDAEISAANAKIAQWKTKGAAGSSVVSYLEALVSALKSDRDRATGMKIRLIESADLLKEMSARLEDTTDLMNQLYYAAQLSREESEAAGRRDMDQKSVQYAQSEIAAWKRAVTDESSGWPSDVAKVVDGVVDEFSGRINAASGDAAQLTPILLDMNRRLTEALNELGAGKLTLNLTAGGMSVHSLSTEKTIDSALKELSAEGAIGAGAIRQLVIADIQKYNGRSLADWRNRISKTVTFSQMEERLPGTIAEALARSAWDRIKAAKEKATDKEKITAINEALEGLRLDMERWFGYFFTKGEKREGLSRLTLLAISGNSIKDLSEKALAKHLEKLIFSKDKAEGLGIEIDKEEMLYAIDLILENFLKMEQAERSKPAHSLLFWSTHSFGAWRIYRSIMGSRDKQMKAVAAAFLRKRGQVYERSKEDYMDTELDIPTLRGRLKDMLGRVIADREDKAGETAKTGPIRPRGPPAASAGKKTLAQKALDATAGFFSRFRRAEAELDIMEILVDEPVAAQPALRKGDRPSQVVAAKAVESRDSVVPVRFGQINGQDSTDLARHKLRQQEAAGKREEDARSIRAAEKDKKGEVVEIDGKRVIIVSPQKSDDVTPADVIQSYIVNHGEKPDVIIYHAPKGGVPPDGVSPDPEEYARRILAARVGAPVPPAGSEVTVYVIDDAAAVTSGKVNFDLMHEYSFSREDAGSIAAEYSRQRGMFPDMGQEGFASGVNGAIGEGAIGLAPVLGRMLMFGKKPDSGKRIVFGAPEGATPEDLRTLKNLALYAGIGAKRLKQYEKEKGYGKPKPPPSGKPKSMLESARAFIPSGEKIEGLLKEESVLDPEMERLSGDPLVRRLIDSPVSVTFSEPGVVKIGDRPIQVAGLAREAKSLPFEMRPPVVLKPMSWIDEQIAIEQWRSIEHTVLGTLGLVGAGFAEFFRKLSRKLFYEKAWKRGLKKYFFPPPEDEFDAAFIIFAYGPGLDDDDVKKDIADGDNRSAVRKLLEKGIGAIKDAREKGIKDKEKKKLEEDAARYLGLARAYGDPNEPLVLAWLAVLRKLTGDEDGAVKYARKVIAAEEELVGLSRTDEIRNEVLGILIEADIKKQDIRSGSKHLGLMAPGEKRDEMREKLFHGAAEAREKSGYWKKAWDESWTKKILGKGKRQGALRVTLLTTAAFAIGIHYSIVAVALLSFLAIAAVILAADFIARPNYKGSWADRAWKRANSNMIVSWIIRISVTMPLVFKPIGEMLGWQWMLRMATFGASGHGISAAAAAIGIVGFKIFVAAALIVIVYRAVNNILEAGSRNRAYYGDLKTPQDRIRLVEYLVDRAKELAKDAKEDKADEAAGLISKAEEVALTRKSFSIRGFSFLSPPPDENAALYILRFYYLARYDEEKDEERKAGILKAAREFMEKAKRRRGGAIEAAARIMEAALVLRENKDTGRAEFLIKDIDATDLPDALKLDLYSVKLEMLAAKRKDAKDDKVKPDIDGEIDKTAKSVDDILKHGENVPAADKTDSAAVRPRDAAFLAIGSPIGEARRAEAKARVAAAKSAKDAAEKTNSDMSVPETKAPPEESKKEEYQGTPQEEIAALEKKLRSLPPTSTTGRADIYYDIMLAQKRLEAAPPVPVQTKAAWYSLIRPVKALYRLIRRYANWVLDPYDASIEDAASHIEGLAPARRVSLIKILIETGKIHTDSLAVRYFGYCVDAIDKIKNKDEKDLLKESELITDSCANIRALAGLALKWQEELRRRGGTYDERRRAIDEIRKQLPGALGIFEAIAVKLKSKEAAALKSDISAASGDLEELLFTLAEYDYGRNFSLKMARLRRSRAGMLARDAALAVKKQKEALWAIAETAERVIEKTPKDTTRARIVAEKLARLYDEYFDMIAEGETIPTDKYAAAIRALISLCNGLPPKEASKILADISRLIRESVSRVVSGNEKINVLGGIAAALHLNKSDHFENAVGIMIDNEKMKASENYAGAVGVLNSVIAFIADVRAPPEIRNKMLELLKSLPIGDDKAIDDNALNSARNGIKTAAGTNKEDLIILDALFALDDKRMERERAKMAKDAEYPAGGPFLTIVTEYRDMIKALSKGEGEAFDKLTAKYIELLGRVTNQKWRDERIDEIILNRNYLKEFLLKLFDIDISVVCKMRIFSTLCAQYAQRMTHDDFAALFKKVNDLAEKRTPVRKDRMTPEEENEDRERQKDIEAIAKAVSGKAGNIINSAMQIAVNDKTVRMALLAEMHNLLLKLDRAQSPKDKLEESDGRTALREKIANIKTQELEEAKDAEFDILKKQYARHIARAEALETKEDFAGAIKEYEEAAKLFEKAFEESPTEPGDKRRAAEAVEKVRTAYEEIADLREKTGNATALSEACNKRDKWITDHWELFNDTVRDEIIKKHEGTIAGKYPFDPKDKNSFAEALHRRFQDSVDDMVRLSNFDPAKRVDAAKSRAGKVLEAAADEEARRKEIEKIDEETAKTNDEIYKKNEEIEKLNGEKRELTAKIDAAKAIEDTARNNFAAAKNRVPTKKEELDGFNLEAKKAELDRQGLEAELDAKNAEIKKAEAELAALTDKNKRAADKKAEIEKKRKEAKDKKDELLLKDISSSDIKKNIPSDIESAIKDLFGVLADARKEANTRAKEACEMLANILKLGNFNDMIFELMAAIEERASHITSAPEKKSAMDRIYDLKIAILKAALGKDYDSAVRAKFTAYVPGINVTFDIAGETLTVPAGRLLNDAVKELSKADEDDALRFLGSVFSRNRRSMAGALAMKGIVDILYRRLGLEAKAQEDGFDISSVLSDGAFFILAFAGVRTAAVKDILRHIVKRHKEESAWKNLSDSQKARYIGQRLSANVPVNAYFAQTVDPLGYVAEALALYNPDNEARDPDNYEAIERCRDALSLDENCLEARMALGRIYMAQGRYDSAREEFKKVAEAKKAYREEALVLLAKIYENMADLSALSDTHKDMAEMYMERKDYKRAVRESEVALELSPGSPELMIRSAKALIKRAAPGDAERAISMTSDLLNRRTRKHFPGFETVRKDALGLRSEAYMLRGSEGDQKRARKDAYRAAKLGYESKPVQALLARRLAGSVRGRIWLIRSKILTRSRDYFKKAIALTEGWDYSLHSGLINVLMRMKNYGEVINAAEAALKIKGVKDDEAAALKSSIIEARLAKARRDISRKNAPEAIKGAEAAKKLAAEISSKEYLAAASETESQAISWYKDRIDGRGLRIRSRVLHWKRNREKLFKLSVEYVEALMAKGTLGAIKESIKVMEGLAKDEAHREKASKELAELYRMRADKAVLSGKEFPEDLAAMASELGVSYAASLDEDALKSAITGKRLGLYCAAIVLDPSNFGALAQRGLIYADMGRTDDAAADLAAAAAVTCGEKDTALAEKALAKLIELMKLPSAERDAISRRSLEEKLSALVRAREAKEKKAEPSREGKGAAAVAGKFADIAVKETRAPADDADADYYAVVLRAENGFDALAGKIRSLVKDGKKDEAARAIEFIKPRFTRPDEISRISALETELAEKNDFDDIDKLIADLKKLEAERQGFVTRLAEALGVKDAEKKNKEGKLDIEKEYAAVQRPTIMARALKAKLDGINGSLAAMDIAGRIEGAISSRGNFRQVIDKVSALVTSGDVKVAIMFIEALNGLTGLRPGEKRSLELLASEAFNKNKEYGNALNQTVGDGVSKKIARAKTYIAAGLSGDIKKAVDIINGILEAKKDGVIDERYDRELIGLIAGVVQAMRKAAGERKEDKIDFTAVDVIDGFTRMFGLLHTLLYSAANVSRIADALLVTDVRNVPSDLMFALLDAAATQSDQDKQKILERLRQMVKAGAIISGSLIIRLEILGLTKPHKALARIILGWAAYNNKSFKDAIAHFNAAAKDKKLKAEALTGRALTVIARNKASSRKASLSDGWILKKAAAALSSDFDANISLGKYFAGRKKYAEAIAAFSKARSLVKGDEAKKNEAKEALDLVISAMKDKILKGRYPWRGAGEAARLADIKALFAEDDSARKDPRFSGVIENVVKRLGGKRKAAKLNIYLDATLELAGCYLAQDRPVDARALVDAEYAYIKGKADFLAVLRDAALAENNPDDAVRYHEKACAADGSYNSKKSPEMAKIYHGKGSAAGIKTSEKLKFFKKAADLEPDNVTYLIDYAEALVGEGKASEAESTLNKVKAVNAVKDMEPERVEKFENITDNAQRLAAQKLAADVKAIKTVDAMAEAFAIEEHAKAIVERHALENEPKEKQRLADELGGMVRRLEALVESVPGAMAILDGPARINERTAMAVIGTPEFNSKYSFQLASVIAEACRPQSGREEELYISAVLERAAREISAGRTYVARKIIRTLNKLNMSPDNKRARALLLARAQAAGISQERDDAARLAIADKAAAEYKKSKSDTDIRTRYTARLGMVKAQISGGAGIEHVALEIIDFRKVNKDKLQSISDMIPEIIGLFMRKASVTKKSADIIKAFDVIKYALFAFDPADQGNFQLIDRALGDLNTCLTNSARAPPGVAALSIDRTFAAKLAAIFLSSRSSSVADRIIALFPFMDRDVGIELLNTILKENVLTDEEKIRLFQSLNRQWSRQVQDAAPFTAPVGIKDAVSAIGTLAAEIAKSRKKLGGDTSALESSLGYLALLYGDFAAAAGHFRRSGRDIHARFGELRAYTQAGDLGKAKRLLNRMKSIFGDSYPGIITAANKLITAVPAAARPVGAGTASIPIIEELLERAGMPGALYRRTYAPWLEQLITPAAILVSQSFGPAGALAVFIVEAAIFIGLHFIELDTSRPWWPFRLTAPPLRAPVIVAAYEFTLQCGLYFLVGKNAPLFMTMIIAYFFAAFFHDMVNNMGMRRGWALPQEIAWNYFIMKFLAAGMVYTAGPADFTRARPGPDPQDRPAIERVEREISVPRQEVETEETRHVPHAPGIPSPQTTQVVEEKATAETPAAEVEVVPEVPATGIEEAPTKRLWFRILMPRLRLGRAAAITVSGLGLWLASQLPSSAAEAAAEPLKAAARETVGTAGLALPWGWIAAVAVIVAVLASSIYIIARKPAPVPQPVAAPSQPVQPAAPETPAAAAQTAAMGNIELSVTLSNNPEDITDRIISSTPVKTGDSLPIEADINCFILASTCIGLIIFDKDARAISVTHLADPGVFYESSLNAVKDLMSPDNYYLIIPGPLDMLEKGYVENLNKYLNGIAPGHVKQHPPSYTRGVDSICVFANNEKVDIYYMNEINGPKSTIGHDSVAMRAAVTAIGVVVPDDKITLPPAPEGYRFIAVPRAESPEATMSNFTRMLPAGAEKPVLIDLKGLTVEKLLGYTYAMSLNPQNISQLDKLTLIKIFDIIAVSLPDAKGLGLDNILSDPEAIPGEFRGADNDETRLNILKSIAKQEAKATADYWSKKPEGFAAAMVDEIAAKTGDGKLSVIAFDEAALAAAAPGKLEALEASSKGKPVRVVTIRHDGTRPIMDQVLEKLGDEAAKVANVSIAMVRADGVATKDIRDYIEQRGEKTVSCVVSTEAADNIIDINTASALYAAKTHKLSFLAWGEFKPDAFDDIKLIIDALGGLFSVKRALDAIQEIFTAIKATAVSA